MSIKWRINFSTLGRYGTYGELCYCQQFEQEFNFIEFNSVLEAQTCSADKVIAFDPSFIPKSGKKTPGLGYFWSGCASSVKRGLGICGIAAIYLEYYTAMHLMAIQSIPEEMKNQLEYYASMLVQKKRRINENIFDYRSRCFLFQETFCGHTAKKTICI